MFGWYRWEDFLLLALQLDMDVFWRPIRRYVDLDVFVYLSANEQSHLLHKRAKNDVIIEALDVVILLEKCFWKLLLDNVVDLRTQDLLSLFSLLDVIPKIFVATL